MLKSEQIWKAINGHYSDNTLENTDRPQKVKRTIDVGLLVVTSRNSTLL